MLLPKYLQAARLRAVKTLPYLATAIYALQPVESRHKELKTLAVDKFWRLYYNPDFCQNLSVAELATCIVHEVNHLLREHAGRCENAGMNPMIFNVSADMEINDDLRYAHLVIPEGAIFPEDFNLDEGKMAEFYYQKIKDLFSDQGSQQAMIGEAQDQSGGSGTEESDEGEGGNEEGDSGEGANFKHPDGHTDPSSPMNGASGSCAYGQQQPWELPDPSSAQNKDAPGINKAESDLIRRNVANDVQKHAKARGNVPGGLERWANSHLKPAVNWKKELAASIRNALTMSSGAFDYTYSRPSRRRIPNVILPSMQQPIPNVSVVIDTSGSMSDRELERAVTEVGGILKSCGQREGVSVLTVDAAVHISKKVFSKNQIELWGGGGTDMRIGIEASEQMKPRPDVCVVVTDGYTPWPDTAPKGMKVVIVLTSGEVSTPQWAKTITLPEENESLVA